MGTLGSSEEKRQEARGSPSLHLRPPALETPALGRGLQGEGGCEGFIGGNARGHRAGAGTAAKIRAGAGTAAKIEAGFGFRTRVGSVSQWGQEQSGSPFQAVALLLTCHGDHCACDI